MIFLLFYMIVWILNLIVRLLFDVEYFEFDAIVYIIIEDFFLISKFLFDSILSLLYYILFIFIRILLFYCSFIFVFKLELLDDIF